MKINFRFITIILFSGLIIWFALKIVSASKAGFEALADRLPETYVLTKKDSLLFDSTAWQSLKVGSIVHIRGRNDIAFLLLDDKYPLIIQHISASNKNLNSIHIVPHEKGSSVGVTYHDLKHSGYSILIRAGIIEKSSAIKLYLSPNSFKKQILGDSLLYTSSIGNCLSFEYLNEDIIDFSIERNNRYLDNYLFSFQNVILKQKDSFVCLTLYAIQDILPEKYIFKILSH